MYVIIKKDKAEKLEEKLHHIKKFAQEVMDCFAEAAEERSDNYSYSNRGRGRYMTRNEEDDWEDDDDRFMARGRGRSGGNGRGRY